jgi:hypothetical protein
MGANAELDIFLKKGDFSLQQLFSLLEREGLYANIKKMIIFDDWKFTNQTQVDLNTLDLNMSDIFLKKFTATYFIVNGRWRCTLLTSFEDAYFDLSFGLDTNDLLSPGENDIDPYVLVLYDQVTDIINDTFGKGPLKERFIAASMGVEYSVSFHSDLMMMLNDDNGGARWIVPKDRGKDIEPEHFLKEEKSNTIVFTRLW